MCCVYITFLKKKEEEEKEKRLHCVKSPKIHQRYDLLGQTNGTQLRWLRPDLECPVASFTLSSIWIWQKQICPSPPLNGKWSRQIEMNFFRKKKYIHALPFRPLSWTDAWCSTEASARRREETQNCLYQAACMGGAACLTLVNICSSYHRLACVDR